MSYNVFFISLGCAKNQVNCEQMMATVQHAGHNIVLSPEGADVAVVNTCGFLASACEEAIDNILEMAGLKQEGGLKKIIVTGCMAQRYKDEMMRELPEVDAVLGTGSYGDIVSAIAEVMAESRKSGRVATITDLCLKLTETNDPVLTNLALRLTPYTAGERFGRWFEGRASVS